MLRLEPRVLPLEGATPEERAAAEAVYLAFRGTSFKHRPRSPEKAAWLREQGIDPERAFALA
jgi:hypothetical protein